MMKVKVTPSSDYPPPNQNMTMVPNPGPLGLLAFGLTTAMLQIKHARFVGSEPKQLSGVDVEVMGFALFFGGLLQVYSSCFLTIQQILDVLLMIFPFSLFLFRY
jgi:succinate-acetate transporter protein